MVVILRRNNTCNIYMMAEGPQNCLLLTDLKLKAYRGKKRLEFGHYQFRIT